MLSSNIKKMSQSKQSDNFPSGCLSEEEWKELVGLEYALAWGYSDDEKRYKELSERRWKSLYGTENT